MTTATKANDLSTRKDFIRCWVHANPEFTQEQASALYDRMERQFPNMTRGGHRGMVGRMQPWENIEHQCPKCDKTVHGIEAVKHDFGLRKYRGKIYVQSWCKCCRRNKRNGVKHTRINPTDVEAAFTN